MNKYAPFLRSLITFVFLFSFPAFAQEDRGYKIFQFPANMIPRIDGDTSDWALFPKEYIIGTDQLTDDNHDHAPGNPKNLDVKVKVAWVKGSVDLAELAKLRGSRSITIPQLATHFRVGATTIKAHLRQMRGP